MKKKEMNLLSLGKNKNILEIGCGYGEIALSISHICNEIYCIDINILRIQELELQKELNNKSNIHPIIANALFLPFQKKYFDLVYSLHFIEHISKNDLRNVLIDIKKLLKPHGQLFLVTPHIFWRYLIPTHVHEYSIRELSNLLRYAGYSKIYWEIPSTKRFVLIRFMKWIPIELIIPIEFIFQKGWIRLFNIDNFRKILAFIGFNPIRLVIS